VIRVQWVIDYTVSYCNTVSQSLRIELHAKQQCSHSACS